MISHVCIIYFYFNLNDLKILLVLLLSIQVRLDAFNIKCGV